MPVQCAAAALTAVDQDFTPIGGQNQHGVCIDIPKQDPHGAAGQDADAKAFRANRRRHDGRERRGDGLRQAHPLHLSVRVAGQKPDGGCRNRAAADGLRHPHGNCHLFRLRQRVQQGVSGQVNSGGTHALGVDAFASRFQNAAIRDCRRAGRLAGAAAQAQVQMPRHVSIRGRQRSFVHFPHQHDPPARAVRLAPRFQIRRAGREAEAAVNAGHQILFMLRVGHGRI